jgi:hypothetical protein
MGLVCVLCYRLIAALITLSAGASGFIAQETIQFANLTLANQAFGKLTT